MKIGSISIFCIVILAGLITGPAFSQETLSMSGIEGSINHKIGTAILEKAYAKIGMNIKSVGFPAKRSLVMANSGDFDGEVQRIGKIDRLYPNLKKVPEPILYLESSVFVKDPAIHIKNWESLSSCLIGIPRGILYLDNHTKGMNRVFVKSQDQLFYLLNTGRIDVVIISTNYGRAFLVEHKDMDIKMLKPPIFKVPLFHFLHKKHMKLIPQIAESIRQMRESGQIDAIIFQYSQSN